MAVLLFLSALCSNTKCAPTHTHNVVGCSTRTKLMLWKEGVFAVLLILSLGPLWPPAPQSASALSPVSSSVSPPAVPPNS